MYALWTSVFVVVVAVLVTVGTVLGWRMWHRTRRRWGTGRDEDYLRERYEGRGPRGRRRR